MFVLFVACSIYLIVSHRFGIHCEEIILKKKKKKYWTVQHQRRELIFSSE